MTEDTRATHALAQAIKVSARVHELKRLAADTTALYQQMLAASGLPEPHFRLRLQLLGMLPRPRREASLPLGRLSPPGK